MNEMKENEREREQEISGENTPPEPARSARPLWVAAIVVLCLAAVAVGFIVDQHKIATQLSSRNQELTASLVQTRGQMQALGSELGALKSEEAAKEKEAQARRQAAVEHARYRNRHPVAKREDPRWKQVESELAEHQKAIDSTQQQVQAERSEFQNGLSSTRNELNGSIAKTHAELVELEKKGERNYYEFDLFKEKEFQREGPIGVSLRKANTKHQFCNLHLLVDDKELSKNHVNLYEPVLFYADGNGQPVELVINRISKNHMHGYVSTAKYQSNAVSAANSAPNQTGAASPAATPGALEHRPGTVR
jgi:hypothetical protein